MQHWAQWGIVFQQNHDLKAANPIEIGQSPQGVSKGFESPGRSAILMT
jgi:hypothetical protein